MLAFADEDERDDTPDEDDDADIDNDSEEDESDEEEGEEDSTKGDESDEDDDKPVTRKELKEILKSSQNKTNAQRRVSSKERRPDVTTPPKPDARIDKIEKSLGEISLTNRKRDFGFQNSLSPDEVDFVFRQTSRPTKKFLETPYVRGAIEAMRAESNVRANTPSSGGRTFGPKGKSWSELEPGDKQANFAERRRAILESKKG